MVRPDKIELVARLTERLNESQSVVLADFKGMTVAELSDLRSQLREVGVPMRVAKNRLIKRAFDEISSGIMDDLLIGNTALTFGVDDPVGPAKIMVGYAKNNEKLVIKGGLLEGKRLDVAGVIALSKMLGRKELLTVMAGDLKQPATKLAGVFQAALLKVARAMDALGRKQQEAGESAV